MTASESRMMGMSRGLNPLVSSFFRVCKIKQNESASSTYVWINLGRFTMAHANRFRKQSSSGVAANTADSPPRYMAASF
jgi:hypothetical protein